MTDPKISITRLLELIRQKMNDLMDYTQLDRRFDLSPKLQQIDIDTCSVLKIISDGFNQQARSGKDFDLEGFQKYLRKETNYKDISQMKGIELVSVGYPV
jgi:replication initiation and membrane attachment protein DnaB